MEQTEKGKIMTNEITQQQSTEVAKKPADVASVFIDRLKDSWMAVLPKICTPDRFARVALTCLRKNPKLAVALQTQEGRLSLSQQFMKCAELGIEPDGRRAYLIPYKNDIQLIIDYKGIAELAMRSGQISNIHADKVCENDEFEYNVGTIEKHRIDFKNDRGKAYAYYAIVTFKDGTKKCEVMSKAEIDMIRRRSKSSNSGPWVTDYDEMAKKTVFRRLSKWLPLSPEMQKAFDIDDEDFPKGRQIVDVSPENDIAPEERYKTIPIKDAEVEEIKDEIPDTEYTEQELNLDDNEIVEE